jgi:hypothetical protein
VSAKSRATVELVLAAVAATGSVVSWLAAGTTVAVTPVLATEPSKTSVVYAPTMIALAFLLATVAGVLVVVGVARLRRR